MIGYGRYQRRLGLVARQLAFGPGRTTGPAWFRPRRIRQGDRPRRRNGDAHPTPWWSWAVIVATTQGRGELFVFDDATKPMPILTVVGSVVAISVNSPALDDRRQIAYCRSASIAGDAVGLAEPSLTSDQESVSSDLQKAFYSAPMRDLAHRAAA